MNEDNNDDQKYFAAREAKATANICLEKGRTFFNRLQMNGYLEKLRKMYNFYYGDFSTSGQDSHQINFTGEQGELTQLPVNHFRNLAQHMLVMVTSNRPVMEARAVNTDYKSMAQTYLANGVLDYYMREKRLEEALKKAVEMAIVLGAGFIKLEWNATSGEAYDADPDTGEMTYEGELEFSNLSPLDVVVDGTKENWNHDWVITRSAQNRFNLMAKYPEEAEKIRGLPSINEPTTRRLGTWSNDDTDDIPVYEFYHKRTEAMPDGRYLLFLSDDIVLMDMKMPYRVLPIFRITPSDILGTPYGYSPMFDVFPIQEGINGLYSSIMSNQNAFAVQSLFVKRGSDINLNNLTENMVIIEGNEKPEPLNLTQTPAEVFKFLDTLIQAAETISGINSVSRGNPEASLKSGNALALVQSMALQFMSGLQGSYVQLIEDVGTALIQILKDYANTPKVIALVGKNNRPLLKEFTGEKISSINRVVVDVGNPLARTTAGRVQMADQLLQMQLIKNPQQYFQVMNTGRIDSMFEGETSELLLIKSENEQMMEGETVQAVFLDQHKIHIQEHKSVLADPDLRRDQMLVANVARHIQQHVDLLRNTDPDLLQLIGEQPLNPMGMAGDPNLPPGPQQAEMNQQGQQMQQEGMANGPLQGAPLESVQMEAGLPQELPVPASPPAPFQDMPTDPAMMPMQG